MTDTEEILITLIICHDRLSLDSICANDHLTVEIGLSGLGESSNEFKPEGFWILVIACVDELSTKDAILFFSEAQKPV